MSSRATEGRPPISVRKCAHRRAENLSPAVGSAVLTRTGLLAERGAVRRLRHAWLYPGGADLDRQTLKDDDAGVRAGQLPRPGWLAVAASGLWALTAAEMATDGTLIVSAASTGPMSLETRPTQMLIILTALIGVTVGALIAWRRPTNPVGWLILISGVSFRAEVLGTDYARYALAAPELRLPFSDLAGWVANWFWIPMYTTFFLSILLFPTGRLPTRRWRPAAWFAVATAVVVGAAASLYSGPLDTLDARQFDRAPLLTSGHPLQLPPVLDGLLAEVFPFPINHLLSAGLLVCAASLVARYRRAGRRERRQIKWVVYAAGLTAALYALAQLGYLGPWGPALAVLGLAGQVSALGIAILWEHLYDIDRLITGTFVFGVLWLGITLAYVGLTAALGLTVGQQLPVPAAVAFILIIALLVQPARTWLEHLAERFVFGARTSGYELLACFGANLEQASSTQELAMRLATAVRQGLGAGWVRVRLLPAGASAGVGLDSIDAWDRSTPELNVPLVFGGETVGSIECGPRRGGDLYDERDCELLTTLGRQAVMAVRNAGLAQELAIRLGELQRQTAELVASRIRLVHAEEAGRRRIERDIHDGVQQQLVALLAKVRLVRNYMQRDPARAESTLVEVQDDARQALQDLRALAQGIHPSVLSDHGLVEALEARLAHLPLEVHLDTQGIARGTRFAEAVEGAAYFVVSEALANILKHAGAGRARVCLVVVDGALRVEVADDGRGFDLDRVERHGLRGLADRIEALGGTFDVISNEEQGTRVTAVLPAIEVARA
jgi:signal transduction histidine kinase